MDEPNVEGISAIVFAALYGVTQFLAVAPQGKPGGALDLLRRFLNPIVGNWGNAQNRDKLPPTRGTK